MSSSSPSAPSASSAVIRAGRFGTCAFPLLLVLAGCPDVDVGDPPVAPPLCRPSLAEFKSTIWETAIAPADENKSCVAKAGCHAIATGRSALRLNPMPASDADFATNLDTLARFMNCATPASSLLITKPEAGVEPHLGGDLWESSGEPIDTVEAWISGR